MKWARSKTFWLVLLLSLAVNYSNADSIQKSSIVGNVIGAANKPLAGVTVRVLDSFLLQEIAKVVTDVDGKFLLLDVLPGLYLVGVDLPALSGMFKRIQVVAGGPTFVDLRSVVSRDQLKDHDAWEKFKWTIRVADRNPLRDDVAINDAVQGTSDSFLATLREFKQSNDIQGEVSYINVEATAGADFNHQMTQFALQGRFEDEGTWSVNGNFADGPNKAYYASGDLQYVLYGHQVGAAVSANDLIFARYPELLQRQLIRRFITSADIPEMEEENKLWIGSIDLKDQWNLFKRLEIGYGTRIDYYGYLEEPVSYSPHAEFSFELTPEVALVGTYYRNQSAPGNLYLQPDDVHPYVHNVAFVPYTKAIDPETTVGFEGGIDFSGSDFQVSLLYHSETVTDKVATVDLKESRAFNQLQASHPFVVFNATDMESRGMAIEVTRKINPKLSATAAYRMSFAVPVFIIEKNTVTKRQLFFRESESLQDYHNLQAGILARIPVTQTQVQADWKWSSGTPFVFGRNESNLALGGVDVEVHQGLPLQMFSQTEFQLMVAVRNLLDQNADSEGNADFQRALVYGAPRVVAGGLLVKF